MSYSSTGSYNWLLFFLRFSALPFLCTHCSLPWCSQGQSFVAHSSQRLRRKTWQTAVLIGLQFAAVSEQLLGQSDTLAAWCPMFKTMRTRRDVWKNMFCFVYVDCQVARLSLSSGMLKPIQDASWDLPAATQSVVSDRSPYSAVWHSSPLLRKSLWAPRCETAQTEFLLPTKALCPGRELEDPPQAELADWPPWGIKICWNAQRIRRICLLMRHETCNQPCAWSICTFRFVGKIFEDFHTLCHRSSIPPRRLWALAISSDMLVHPCQHPTKPVVVHPAVSCNAEKRNHHQSAYVAP